MKLFDRMLFAVLGWRLAMFRRPQDDADRFADGIRRLIQSEVARRNRYCDGWAKEADRLQQIRAVTR
jgi:hypothetical protein